jgi:YD repeat-containing protein
MVSVIGEQGLGLFGHTQLGLGQSSTLGDAKTRLTVNAATGNLVITRRDDTLAGNGIDTDLLRTYNSQGTLNQGSVGQFRFGFDQSLSDFPADKTSGTIIRNDGEGLAATFTWNDSQQRYISTSGNGSFDTLHFDTANNQWVFTDGESLTTEIYDQAGQLQSITDKEGQTLSLQYQDGRLTEIVDASGNSTYLSYTDEGFVKRIHTLVDGNEHNLARYQYDELNRISKVVIDLTPSDNTILDGAVYSTTYTYHQDSSRIATISHSDGSYTEFDYIEHNSKWYVNQISDGNGQLTRFNYDLVNNLTTMTDANGSEWQYLYNGTGQIVETRTPAVNGQISIQYYQYDSKGNLTEVRDALDNTREYQHDEQGNIIREQHADGTVIERSYDANNQLLTETLSQLDLQTSEITNLSTTRYAYDENGLLLFQVSGEGRVMHFEYNSKGQLISQFGYPESIFNLANYSAAQAIILSDLQAWQGMQDKSKRSRTDYIHDIRGQLQRSQEFSRVDINGVGVANEQLLEVHYQYDLSGRLIAQATLRGQDSEVQRFDYDGLGRLVLQSDNAGNTSSWVYDDAQRTITLTQANGAKEVQLRDQAGQVIQTSQVSLLDQTRDTLYRYDNDGRQTAKQSPSGVREYQFYNAKGQLAAQVDGTGAFTHFEYDLNGNQTKTTEYALRIDTSAWWGADALTVSDYLALLPTDSNQDRISEKFYDNRNRVSHTVDAEGHITRNFYDNNSRLIRTEELSSSEAQRLGLKVEISNSKRLIEQDNVDPFGTPDDDVIIGNDKADTLYGYDGDDILDGKDSNDNLQGGLGNDTLYGGEGKDTLKGGDDNDTLFGGYGIDNLDGDKGDDVLYAGSGNDTIYARYGNNSIIGGAGDDRITTDYNANNTIVYAKGDGWDTITQSNNNPEFSPATDIIKFEDLKSDEVLIYWAGSYLHLQNPEDDGGMRINITSRKIPFSSIEFSDGINLSWAEVEARANQGVELNELISPTDHRDQLLNGAGGNDSITTLKGNDTLLGGSGNDRISYAEGYQT